MLLTGRLVSADEGYRLGFVNEVVPAAELMAGGGALGQARSSSARRCSSSSPRSRRTTGFGLPVDEAIARDWQERIPRLLASQDYVEGPKAFSERRKPVWTGR